MYFFILQVSVSHDMDIKRIQANPGNGCHPGTVASRWTRKERTEFFVTVFVQTLCLLPGLRLMLGTWPRCGVHRVTDLGHQIPPKPRPVSPPAAVMDLQEVSELCRIQAPCFYSSALDTEFSLSCRLPGSAPNKCLLVFL